MGKKLNHNIFIAYLLLIFLSNIFFKVRASDSFKDLDVDWTIKDNPTYKIEKPLPVLVVEQIQSKKIDTQAKLELLAQNQYEHAILVSFRILSRYTDPCSLLVLYNDFNKPEESSGKDHWNKAFQKELMSFINCSFASRFEDTPSTNFKNLVESAIKNNKTLIFGAGNDNQRVSFFLEDLKLTEDQEKRVVFVGALDKRQKPSLYSAVPGKKNIQFIWTKGCAFANQEFQEVGTSLAAPRVTGSLCRLKGIHPDLTDQEALDIVFLTATKSCFYSTGDQDLDNYLYGPYGALDSMAAFQFAAEFVLAKEATKELTPQGFYNEIKRVREEFQLPKTLRDQLNLMAFLEQHYDTLDSDDEEKKVLTALQKIAQKIDLEVLYSQPQEYFIPDDLYAFQILTVNSQDMSLFEAFIKRIFKADVRSLQGYSILHHVVDFNSFELVKHYTEISPTLVNDVLDKDKVSPLHIAAYTKDINLSIIRFLLERGASIYIEESVVQPLEIILQNLLTLEDSDNKAEKVKEVALLFLNHKDYDPQKFLPEGIEHLEELKLNEKYPEIYERLVGKDRLN